MWTNVLELGPEYRDEAQDYYEDLYGVNELRSYLNNSEAEALMDELWEDGRTLSEIEDILEDKGYI